MTRYFVRYRVNATGRENETNFDSMTTRSLWIITMAPHIEILKEWVGQ
jgi:hypothetical protein